MDQLNGYLSNLLAGNVEIDTSQAVVLRRATADVDWSTLVQECKSLVLLESTAIMDTLKSRLEMFRAQPLPTIFDRIQQIGGESGFSLEKLERAIVAAARVQIEALQGGPRVYPRRGILPICLPH